MSQNIRQADDILFHSVKSERKQVSEIVRKHFWESTCACAHSLFIMHHIFVRFIGFPVRVTNTGPVVSLFFYKIAAKAHAVPLAG